MGSAEGVVGHSGWGSVEETTREYPSPRPAAEETQSALPVALQEPGKISAVFAFLCSFSAFRVLHTYNTLTVYYILYTFVCILYYSHSDSSSLSIIFFSRRVLSREKRCAKPAQRESPSKANRGLVSSQSSS